MHAIKETLISDDLLAQHFVCDLSACKGACCVEGDSGAPLNNEEVKLLEELYPKIAPFLPLQGNECITQKGTSVVDKDGDTGTPLLTNGTCAYAIKDENNCLKCGIEAAYTAGEIDFQKPISCHLFPVRIKEYPTFTAVNVQLLEICSAACDLGKQLKVPVYQFLKAPLIRRFGEEWYQTLEKAAQK